MTRSFNYLIGIWILASFAVHAQSLQPQHATAAITATATVVGNVDLIVLKDMGFDIGDLSATEYVVDPQSNSQAGEIKIIGTPNGLVRVTFAREALLRHEGGGPQLRFSYSLSGGTSVVQSQSSLLTLNNQIHLSDEGTYYLWVGGHLSGVENIMPGTYDMELSLELEYIQ